jgi:large subunit ribosomal protein L22
MTFGVKTNERPGTRAVVRHAHLSAYKAREVLDLIRGAHVADADELLALVERDAAIVIRKCLASAVANAEANDDQDPETLYVSACFADEGPTLKRWRPRARGRATRIRKRTCHITIIVSRMSDEELRLREQRGTSTPGRARRTAQRASEARRARVARSRQREAEKAGLSPEEEAKADEAEATAEAADDAGAVEVTGNAVPDAEDAREGGDAASQMPKASRGGGAEEGQSQHSDAAESARRSSDEEEPDARTADEEAPQADEGGRGADEENR